MSSVGAIPGYAYPAFDYTQAEFFDVKVPNVTAGGGGVAFTTLVTADRNGAVFLREAGCLVGTTAAVGTRTVSLQLDDPEGNFVYRYSSPLAIAAGASVTNQWSLGISSAYSAGTAGYSPFGALVIPPGYFWVFLLTSAQAGDTIQFMHGTGLRIPSTSEHSTVFSPVPTPLIL